MKHSSGLIRTLAMSAILGAILAYGCAGALDHYEAAGVDYSQCCVERYEQSERME